MLRGTTYAVDDGWYNPATTERHDDKEERGRKHDEEMERDAYQAAILTVIVVCDIADVDHRGEKIDDAQNEAEDEHHVFVCLPAGVRSVYRRGRYRPDGCLNV